MSERARARGGALRPRHLRSARPRDYFAAVALVPPPEDPELEDPELEDPEPEDPELPEPESLEGVLVGVVAGAAVLELLVLDGAEDEDVPLLFEPPEYRSEYQPPPFKMKLPDWICRLAFGSLQFGQSFSAFSVMRWTRSNSWPQFSHR